MLLMEHVSSAATPLDAFDVIFWLLPCNADVVAAAAGIAGRQLATCPLVVLEFVLSAGAA
jgi:hypothetical protein